MSEFAEPLLAGSCARDQWGESQGFPTGWGSAVKPTIVSRAFALCPYCQPRNGQIFSDGQGGQFCQCADCGPIALRADDRAAVTLDEQWLRSRLRMALEIESRDGITDIADGVWRLGDARREPVLLARSLMRLWAEPSIFDRVRVRSRRREGLYAMPWEGAE